MDSYYTVRPKSIFITATGKYLGYVDYSLQNIAIYDMVNNPNTPATIPFDVTQLFINSDEDNLMIIGVSF